MRINDFSSVSSIIDLMELERKGSERATCLLDEIFKDFVFSDDLKDRDYLKFNSDILPEIRKIVFKRKAKGEKISLTSWIEEACIRKLNKEKRRF